MTTRSRFKKLLVAEFNKQIEDGSVVTTPEMVDMVVKIIVDNGYDIVEPIPERVRKVEKKLLKPKMIKGKKR